MDAQIKARIQARLRSGRDPQTRGCLNRTEDALGDYPAGLCCLGVICEIAVEDGIVVRVNHDGRISYRDARDPDAYESFTTLPVVVAEWMGLDPDLIDRTQHNVGVNPTVSVSGTLMGLARVNDGLRWTFPQIADLFDQL